MVEVAHTHGAGAGGEGIHPPHGQTPKGKYFYLLALGALGVVYGDIGTSPLYALYECFYGKHGIDPTRTNVMGVLSLIVWALIIIISIKYLVFVMRADNRGEGGILSLMSLLRPSAGQSRPFLILLGLFGAALLYGDGVITPAITTLSAVEGLKVAIPGISHWVLPLTIAIIIGLFLMQKRGTGGIGKIFGPVMLVWFTTLSVLGVINIKNHLPVLAAVSPHYAAQFFLENGFHSFVVLGSVFLVVTGGESLYVDMGHFGKKPIKLVWFTIVLPALLLNYFGQGALILTNPQAARDNVFFNLAPGWFVVPLVGLATVAAAVASQAVISGAFSLTRQAVQLGYSPRVHIEHTSAREIGQIYIPGVNWALMIGSLTLVLYFGSATRLAAAYGLAVTATMVITTVLYFVVAREKFKWKTRHALVFLAVFFTIDISFFGANALKIVDGGYVPLIMASAVFPAADNLEEGPRNPHAADARSIPSIDLFLADVARKPQIRVPGTAVFLTGTSEGVPPALLHNLKHNKIIHKQVVLLTVKTREIPHVDESERIETSHLLEGFFRVIAHYGFMEDPNIPDIMKMVRESGIDIKPMETTFFLGRENIITTTQPGMPVWQKKLFEVMARNARSATSFFGIPYNQVVEIGAQIEL